MMLSKQNVSWGKVEEGMKIRNKSEISRDDYNNMQYGQHVPDRPYGLLGSTDGGIIAENERLKSVIREVTDVSHITISIFNLFYS